MWRGCQHCSYTTLKRILFQWAVWKSLSQSTLTSDSITSTTSDLDVLFLRTGACTIIHSRISERIVTNHNHTPPFVPIQCCQMNPNPNPYTFLHSKQMSNQIRFIVQRYSIGGADAFPESVLAVSVLPATYKQDTFLQPPLKHAEGSFCTEDWFTNARLWN